MVGGVITLLWQNKKPIPAGMEVCDETDICCSFAGGAGRRLGRGLRDLIGRQTGSADASAARVC